MSVVEPGEVRLRLVQPAAAGAVLLGRPYAGTWLSGPDFASGTVEWRAMEEGQLTLKLPNATGRDGVRHIDRFLCLSSRASYRPGDEFVEVWRTGRGGPEFVGWPIDATVTPTEINLTLADALALLKHTRETDAGTWCHAPRDVMEHYGRVWRFLVAEPFADDPGLTYSGTEQTSADGKWRYLRGERVAAGSVRLRTAAAAGSLANIGRDLALDAGVGSADRYAPWRIETTITPVGWSSSEQRAILMLGTVDPTGVITGRAAAMFVYYNRIYCDTGGYYGVDVMLSGISAPVQLAIEGRDDWVYFYVQGVLRQVLPVQNTPAGSKAYLLLDNGSAAASMSCDVDVLRFRRADRLLVADGAGDLRLPGNPAPGGLWGEYFSLAGLGVGVSGNPRMLALNPTTDAGDNQRLDPQIHFNTANPPTWQLGVPSGEFAVRWSGSVYLDLDNYDYSLRLSGDDWMTAWVGRTRGGEHVATAASNVVKSAWLKSGAAGTGAPGAGTSGPLYGQRSGWYPIRVQYVQAAGPAQAVMDWQRSDNPGTFVDMPSTSLSPFGLYRDRVRRDSHYDALQAVAKAFGHQFSVEPAALGSTAFPGRLAPVVRLGRDTGRVLGMPEATDVQVQLTLNDVADVVVGDAAGLADQMASASLSAEAINDTQVAAHLFAAERGESLSDITTMGLLQQRLSTLLALHGSAYEEVSANPRGARELADSFPLTGALAEFAWAPGDAVRLGLPALGIEDNAPRQILGLSRDFVPDGFRGTRVSFRPRPRSLAQTLRDMRRQPILQARNYQGQLAIITGSIGSSITSWGGVDAYSRVTIPPQCILIAAFAYIDDKDDASTWALEINGTDRLDVAGRGVYDVRAYATPYAPLSGAQEMYARLRSKGAGSTGNWKVRLALTIRV